jgi:hypothetical protein
MSLSIELINYLKTQNLFIKMRKELPYRWYSFDQGPEHFVERKNYFDTSYNLLFPNMSSVPIIHHHDDYLFDNKDCYLFVHDSYPDTEWAIKNLVKYSTPREVWENVIKPDIEEYYSC